MSIVINIVNTVLSHWGVYKTTLFSAHYNRILDEAIGIFEQKLFAQIGKLLVFIMSRRCIDSWLPSQVILKLPLPLGTNNEYSTWQEKSQCCVQKLFPLGLHSCHSLQEIWLLLFFSSACAWDWFKKPLIFSYEQSELLNPPSTAFLLYLIASYLPSCKMKKYVRVLKGTAWIVFKVL